MANRKITQFPAFNGADIKDDDLLTLVHVFEVDPSLKNKKITFTEFKKYLNQFYITATGIAGDVTINGDLTVTGELTANAGEFNNIAVINDDDVLVARISGDDNGSASFASGAFTIADDGDTRIAGTLGVSGIFTIASGLSANGTTGTSGFFLASNGPDAPARWESIPGIGGDGVFDTITVRSGITNSGDLTTSGLTVTGNTAFFQSGISVTGNSTFSGLVTASGITATGTISGQVFVVTIGQGSVGLDMGSGTISGSANGPNDTNGNSVVVKGPLVILP